MSTIMIPVPDINGTIIGFFRSRNATSVESAIQLSEIDLIEMSQYKSMKYFKGYPYIVSTPNGGYYLDEKSLIGHANSRGKYMAITIIVSVIIVVIVMLSIL